MKPNDTIVNEEGRTACPECEIPVSEPYRLGDYIVRRHNRRKDDGKLCEYGHGEGDPVADEQNANA